jgi:hypothetical protein
MMPHSLPRPQREVSETTKKLASRRVLQRDCDNSKAHAITPDRGGFWVFESPLSRARFFKPFGTNANAVQFVTCLKKGALGSDLFKNENAAFRQ